MTDRESEAPSTSTTGGGTAYALRASKHAAVALAIVGVVDILLLYASMLMWLTPAQILGAPALVLIVGTVKGILFIWFSTQVRRGQLTGWAIGVVAYFLSADVVGVGITRSMGPEHLPVVTLLLHALALTILLGLLIRARRALAVIRT